MPSSSPTPTTALALTPERARGARPPRPPAPVCARRRRLLISVPRHAGVAALLLSGRQQQYRRASCRRPLHILGSHAKGLSLKGNL